MTVTNPRVALAALALFIVVALPAAADGPAGGLDLQQYRGRVVVVDFWASWCVPCRRSFPWLNRLQAELEDEGLVIIGVNVDTDPAEADAFLAEVPADFRIVRDPGGDLARRFEVIAMPSSYVIGRDGELAATHLGFRVKQQDEYEQHIRAALARGEDG